MKVQYRVGAPANSTATATFRLGLIAMLCASLVFTTACGENKAETIDSRSMEQIYDEEGVPVRVIQLADASLSNELTFMATMSGVKETTLTAKIADKIVSLPVRVGQRVSEGQVVATFPTDNAQIQWEQAKTAFDNAKKTYDRMAALLKAGDIAQAQYDGAETQFLVAKQNFESLKQMVYIDAPFSGTVVNIPVKVGDKVTAGATLLTIAQTGTMVGRVWATETEVGLLKVGMPATITIDGKEYTGRVATVALSMDAQKRAFQVDVNFNNSRGEIKSGTTCDMKFQLSGGAARQSVVIPRRLIKTNGDEQYVFVAEGETAKKVPIRMGQISGVNVEIIEGLKTADRVISEGITLLETGKKIRIID